VTILKEIGFLLSEKLKCHPKNIFGVDAYVLVNKLVDVNAWSKTQNDKSICCPSIFKISIQQQISGRLDIFLSQGSCHPPTFLLLTMEQYIILFQIQLKFVNNMRLQLAISLHSAFAYILHQ